MKRIHKDLYWLRGLGGFINAYLWQGTTLMDAGAPALSHAFRYEMKQAGFAPRSVRKALVSHCHADHAGGLMHFPQDLTVHAGPEDLAVLQGEAPAHGYHPQYGGVITALERLLPTYQLAENHTGHATSEGDDVEGWRAIEVPGHTPGSLVWYQPETRTVFVGDLLVHHFGFLQGPRPLFTPHYDEAIQSLGRLRELEIETILFGHGRPLTVRAEQRLHRLIDRLQARLAPTAVWTTESP